MENGVFFHLNVKFWTQTPNDEHDSLTLINNKFRFKSVQYK
jgi:hypothetical protein